MIIGSMRAKESTSYNLREEITEIITPNHKPMMMTVLEHTSGEGLQGSVGKGLNQLHGSSTC